VFLDETVPFGVFQKKNHVDLFLFARGNEQTAFVLSDVGGVYSYVGDRLVFLVDRLTKVDLDCFVDPYELFPQIRLPDFVLFFRLLF
jgi:hypothetical protein